MRRKEDDGENEEVSETTSVRILVCLFVGQHLITAMAEQMFGFKTTSW